MSDISVKTLKAGAKLLGLEIESNKKKELEAAIDEKLTEMELGYECPSCGKDIPDVETCYYCGESFADEEAAEEATEEATEDEAEDEAEEGTEEAISDEAAEEIAEEISKTDEKASKGKGKGTGKTGKDKEEKADDKTEKSKAGRPQGKTKNTEEKEKEFEKLVEGIDAIVGDGFEKRERKTGVTYVQGGKRLLKAVSTGKTLSIEFNVEVKSEDDDLVKYTVEEAKAKHLGSTRAIYSFGEEEVALKLVKEAFKGFKAAVKEAAEEE